MNKLAASLAVQVSLLAFNLNDVKYLNIDPRFAIDECQERSHRNPSARTKLWQWFWNIGFEVGDQRCIAEGAS